MLFRLTVDFEDSEPQTLKIQFLHKIEKERVLQSRNEWDSLTYV